MTICSLFRGVRSAYLLQTQLPLPPRFFALVFPRPCASPHRRQPRSPLLSLLCNGRLLRRSLSPSPATLLAKPRINRVSLRETEIALSPVSRLRPRATLRGSPLSRLLSGTLRESRENALCSVDEKKQIADSVPDLVPGPIQLKGQSGPSHILTREHGTAARSEMTLYRRGGSSTP